MTTTPTRTSHLSGRALAYAVAKATSQPLEILPSEYGTGPRLFAKQGLEIVRYRPDLDPAQAWPLLVKYGRRCRLHLDFQCNGASYLEAGIRTGHTANDMLTAAMRALVSHLLGPQVDIPTELLEATQEGAA